jgi:hypothetical protein
MPAERGTRGTADSTSISAASARPRSPRFSGDIGQHERQAAAAIHPPDRRHGTKATFLVLAVIVIALVMTAAWWIT